MVSPGPSAGEPAVRVTCAGAVVRDADERVLLVWRRFEPGAGLWSIPGGRVEPGETVEDAVVREVREETGLTVLVGPLLGRVERPGAGGAVYDIHDHLATVVAGDLLAGDDADAVGWFDAAALGALPVTDGLREALREWGVLDEGSPETGFEVSGPVQPR